MRVMTVENYGEIPYKILEILSMTVEMTMLDIRNSSNTVKNCKIYRLPTFKIRFLTVNFYGHMNVKITIHRIFMVIYPLYTAASF